jgi:hypothetical protein
VIVTRGSAVVHLDGCGPLDVRATCRHGRIGFGGLQGLGDLAGTGQVQTIAPEEGARTMEFQVEAGDVTVSWEQP